MKKTISLILVLALVMAFVVLPSNAASTGPVARIGSTTYDTLQEAIDTATGSKLSPVTITLINDTVETVTILNKKYICLDLNGHTIDGNGEDSVIYNGGDLIITDSSDQSSGKITGGVSRIGSGGGVYNTNTLSLRAGTITACSATRYGGGVYNDDDGLFVMTGGSIENCYSGKMGGGIYNSHDLCMLGGTIRNCTSGQMGGGIANQSVFNSKVEFIMKNGQIVDCVSSVGGGVYNNTNCVIRMDGGTISGCSAVILEDYPDSSGRGGGIYNYGGQITMNGGNIEACSSVVNGYSVFVNAGSFNVNGGTIDYDIANVSGTIVVTGGEFGQDVSSWVPDGYQCAENASNTHPYTVYSTGGYLNSVARIGEVTYSTLQRAIDESTGSETSPAVIVLTNNTQECLMVDSGQYIILDLNGYTIDAQERDSVIVNLGDLTLRDSSAAQTGSITGGKAKNGGGGVYCCENSSITMESGSIIACCADVEGGGGVYCEDNSSFTMEGGSIIACYAEEEGGGIRISNTSVCTLKGGTISECTSGINGGGVFSLGELTLDGATISNCTNSRNSSGGGVYNGNQFTLKSGVISGCSGYTGGGVYNSDNCIFTIEDGVICNCTARYGAGIYTSSGTVNLFGGNISKNTAYYGGGIYSSGGNIVFNDGFITDCIASHNAGGVYNGQGTFTMAAGMISNCQASVFGGGVYNGYDSTFIMRGGTISQCRADSDGGGVSNLGGTFTVEDGIISDCQAANGGGINTVNTSNGGTSYSAVLTMKNGVLANCLANSKGGGIYVGNGTFTMEGGTISGCSASNGAGIYNGNNSTIKGGTITNCSATLSDSDAIYQRLGTLTIEGGMLGGSILYDDGAISIIGGSFMQDVTDWVAEGYQCVTTASEYPYSVCPVDDPPDPGDDPPDPGDDPPDPGDDPPNPDADVTFSMDQVSGKPGDTVNVGLYVDSKVDINTIGVNLTSYPSDVLMFAGFENPGEIISNSMTGTAGMDSDKAVIAIGYIEARKYSGKICDLKFVIREDAQDAEAIIKVNAVAKKGSTGYSTYVQSGTVSIKNYILGDLNGDENVDIEDAVALLQYSIFPDFYPLSYSGNVDFNHDGNIDIDDAVLLLQYSIFPEFYPIS